MGGDRPGAETRRGGFLARFPVYRFVVDGAVCGIPVPRVRCARRPSNKGAEGATPAAGGARAMIEPIEEKDRFYSRLAMIPGIRPMPSVGSWILLQVKSPTDLARRVNRRLAPGVVSVPRHVDGAVRIQVADPKTNEQLLRALREVVS